MPRFRTVLTACALALAVSACGAQSGSTAAAGNSTPAAATTTAKAQPKPAPTKAAATTAAAVTSSPAASSPAATTSAPTPSATVSVSVTPAADVRPHFDSPQAAMTYLATAWNTGNMVDLKHVTQGAARELLLAMHHEAVNLRLKSCSPRKGMGDFMCTFTHDYPSYYPVKYRKGKTGTAEFIAAPSSSVGWYMFAYEGCG